MQYTLQSGKRTMVAKHKHATVLLEQQLIAINKQEQRARHESFTTAACQTQFGSCDPVPQLYPTAPQLKSIVVDGGLMSFAMTSRGLRAGTSNGRTRNHVSLPGFVVRQAVSLQALSVQGVSMEAFAAANKQ
jgi:hypothetical protein